MTSTRRKGLTWALSGAVFITVIVVAGCAKFGSSSSTTTGVEGTEPTTDAPAKMFEARVELVAAAPKVNIFGELDGVEREPAAKSPGNAGFQQHTFVDDGYDGDVAVDPKG